MKVPNILLSAIPTSSHSRSRGGRSNGDFHPLTSEQSENFQGRLDTVPNDFTGRQRLLSESSQKPIELTCLSRPSRQNNETQTDCQNTSVANNGFSGHFMSTNQFESNFQVYNATSEELPGVDDSEDVIPFTLSDVKLRVSEFLSGEGGTDENIVPKMYSNGTNYSRCCCTFGNRINTCKAYAILICTAITLSFIAVVCTVFILKLTKHSGKAFDTADENIISSHIWPLQDIESKSLNISFDVENMGELSLNFEDEEERRYKEKDSSLKSKATKKVIYPGIFSLNGHLVDQAVFDDVIHSAKEILTHELNNNSSHVDVLSWKGIATDYAITELETRLNATGNKSLLEGLFEESLCHQEPEIKCVKTGWYRSINGTCNNVKYISWGSQFAPLRRIIKPNPTNKLSVGRFVTTQLTEGTLMRDPEASGILPLWAMFILHDTLKMPEPPVPCNDATDIGNEVKAESTKHTRKNVCDMITPTVTALKPEINNTVCSYLIPCSAIYPSCTVGPRTSFNLATSYIDASNIYGSSEDRTNKLRLKENGKMRTIHAMHKDGKQFLPLATELNETCLMGNGATCFISGDDDVNQLSALTALNTLFVRQHNKIAGMLSRTNSHWDDEQLFQESRRIVIAQIQHITYNEFLPEILGNSLMNESRLQLDKSGYYELYSSHVDASISDAFAGAAGYFWYSMAVGRLQFLWKFGKDGGRKEYDISAQILKPELLMKRKGFLEAIIRGFTSLAVNRVGLEFAPRLRSLPIKPLNKTVDLVKWVLEMGQSLNLPPYVEWRKTCGLVETKTFEEVEQHWYTEAYSRIKSVYSDVGQVDVFTGMLAELPLHSARVGPLLACLLIDQFSRFKRGDRFWYEGDVYFNHFTEAQLKSLRETTLSRILCDNTDRDFDEIQKSVMLLTSFTNPIVPCSDFQRMPGIEFHLWKVKPGGKPSDYSGSEEIESDEEWDIQDFIEEQSEQEKDVKERTVPVTNIQSIHSYVLEEITTPKMLQSNNATI